MYLQLFFSWKSKKYQYFLVKKEKCRFPELCNCQVLFVVMCVYVCLGKGGEECKGVIKNKLILASPSLKLSSVCVNCDDKLYMSCSE